MKATWVLLALVVGSGANYLSAGILTEVQNEAQIESRAQSGLASTAPASQSEPQPSSQATGQSSTSGAPENSQNRDTGNARKASANDALLERKVRDKLFAIPEFKNLNIEARNGVVTLTGTVNSAGDLSKATNVVNQVRGVRSVNAKISVGSSTSVAPNKSGPVNTGTGAMAPNTAGSIAGNTEQSSGRQNSAEAASQAPSGSASAGSAPGTSSQQTPGASAANESNPNQSNANQSNATQSKDANASSQVAPRMTSATQLQSQIQVALTNEPTLANSNINVNVTEDEIALSGSVSNGKERQTAERIARSFAENRRVTDHLTVGGKK
jgi:hyperosmotically inducible protein